MQTSYVSTVAMRNQTRTETLRLQSELTDRTTEIATSRKADVGLALGTGTGRTIAARNNLSLLETLIVSNAGATERLGLTQSSLADLETVSSEMVKSLTALPTGQYGAQTINTQAAGSLDRLVDRLNASDGDSYLFGGLNSAEPPMKRFDAGPRQEIAAAFTAKFGFAPGDPAAAALTPADVESFIDNEFSAFFEMPGWTDTFSSASSQNVVSQISTSDRMETGTNANESAIRTMAKGLAMIAGLGFESLAQGTRDAIVAKSRLVMGNAVADVVSLKGDLGYAQNAIARADDRLRLSRDLVTEKITTAEGADPAEAKTRLDQVTTQIEMSYALTAQLSRLSILNYR